MSYSEHPSWQKLLANAITDPLELLQILALDPRRLDVPLPDKTGFSLRVPRGFVARMKKGDYNDPLLRQVLPVGDELLTPPHFVKDPVSESAKNPLPGILHKYHGRVLFMLSGACAIHCRYCFRRHFSYADNTPGTPGLEKALTYVARDTSIKEFILSGGDPLVASDKQLEKLVVQVAKIRHIRTLRIHSRLPIVLPERVDQTLLNWLKQTNLRPVLVLHCNHPQEIDSSVAHAVRQLREAGVTLLNQTGLLRHINDSLDTLVNLSERLFDIGVLPYYLHLLDKVQGASHFDIPEITAKQLVRGMMEKLPGYLVPRLVRELPNTPHKWPIAIMDDSSL